MPFPAECKQGFLPIIETLLKIKKAPDDQSPALSRYCFVMCQSVCFVLSTFNCSVFKDSCNLVFNLLTEFRVVSQHVLDSIASLSDFGVVVTVP